MKVDNQVLSFEFAIRGGISFRFLDFHNTVITDSGIKQDSKILLLNREFSAWMGCWNGVGGKLEVGESPRECIIREINEETGLNISNVQFKGIESWFIDHEFVGGMYLYVAELSNEQIYQTPIKTYEGILDWKECDWIINPKNMGVANDIPVTLKPVLFEEMIYEHRCLYKDGKLAGHQIITIDKDYELLEKKEGIEAEISRRYLKECRGIR